MYRYRHGTIVIGSALPLPDLISDAALIGDSDCDVIIRPGAVPDSLPDVTSGGPLWQVAPDGAGGLRVLITIPGIARFLVTGGREVLVEAGPAVAERPDRLLTWLYGTVFSGLLLQRGTLPLHVASIRTPHGLLAITGQSGAGKSTLAGALLSRGHRLLADDLLQLVDGARPDRLGSRGPLTGHAGVPRLRLSVPAITAFGLSDAPWQPVEGRDKSETALPLPGRGAADRAPGQLAALVVLAAGAPDSPARLDRLTGIEAIRAVQLALYRPGLTHAMIGTAATRTICFLIAARLPIWRLTRPMGLDRIDHGITALAPLLG
ncbi:hypothetical protein WG926_06050 [Tistrella sp. BH-R2-4]|uniref:HPr kinase/phosphorylase C-terminal domain-containing protein n=1 Tax=Tistrella arctica TaxID=3133430 RepID=A0ABU9YGE7_9PROT